MQQVSLIYYNTQSSRLVLCCTVLVILHTGCVNPPVWIDSYDRDLSLLSYKLHRGDTYIHNNYTIILYTGNRKAQTWKYNYVYTFSLCNTYSICNFLNNLLTESLTVFRFCNTTLPSSSSVASCIVRISLSVHSDISSSVSQHSRYWECSSSEERRRPSMHEEQRQ